MIRLTPGGLAKALFKGVADAVIAPFASLVDGKLTIRGFHPGLAPATPHGMATVLAESRPAFSSAATKVDQHWHGVTSYDITPGLGPKFAYDVAGLSHFDIPGAGKISVVELAIGPKGSTSDYEGRAFHVFGQTGGKPWAAELWDDVKAKTAFADATATIGHNGIVDGVLGRNGFRGLAKAAHALEKRGTITTSIDLPQVAVTDSLISFVRQHVPALQGGGRDAVVRTLRDAQSKQGRAWTSFAGAPAPAEAPRPAASPSVQAGPLARHLLST